MGHAVGFRALHVHVEEGEVRTLVCCVCSEFWLMQSLGDVALGQADKWLGALEKPHPNDCLVGARDLRLFVHRWERATRLDLAPQNTLSRVGILINAFPELSGNSVWHGLVCQEKFTGI